MESKSEEHVKESLSAPTDAGSGHDTLKYQLLGPSLTKAGQDTVDQQKVRTFNVLVKWTSRVCMG